MKNHVELLTVEQKKQISMLYVELHQEDLEPVFLEMEDTYVVISHLDGGVEDDRICMIINSKKGKLVAKRIESPVV